MDAIPSDGAQAGATPDLAIHEIVQKLQPLLDSGRLDNLIDLLSIASDIVDLLDCAMVEKLATLFEQTTSVSWELGNAVRMAKSQTQALEHPDSLYGLLTLLREPDTRRGVGLILRTLNVIGRQL
ncbi:hypothetical protein GCM10009091_48510 [Pseudomonas brenneri]|jgi:uncharacterized protein YjgD (DUF1641 family)|uniref:DUF1641 domain-containing protein n=1 Tax=Pseudomonas brenneri TaxID=129817 RepID=A0A5B2UKW9_9PSED|nr:MULTISPECIES: DUF1641 domain-containing protein [Pseudomonas]KAA2226699.1 DUF1641 domain-containing protein [Pseudomonas brenneri]TWR74899.1 DUF1641 domain-containing protein [Pseudomonas brenneri]CRM04276.1 hypothetical protein [Pseudomonas sp. 25 R 14]SDU91076.1 Protein of unknown function [Pseudomonas brenneri]GGL61081.1 hypothetical protein GCM10009091_48510 [Pseudomonas brenneri]